MAGPRSRDAATGPVCPGRELRARSTAIDLDGLRSGSLPNARTILELRAQAGRLPARRRPRPGLHGSDAEIGDEDARNLIATASERTFDQDAAFGLRQLVDIAARGLSPGVNDPTTAVQALDQIHDALLRLGAPRLYSGVLRGDDGACGSLVPVHSWDDYVHLAIDEIRIYGEGSLQVSRRLHALLETLQPRLPECRRAAVEQQLRLLDGLDRGGLRTATPTASWARLQITAVGGTEGGG